MSTANIQSLKTTLFLPLNRKQVKRSLKSKYQTLSNWKQNTISSTSNTHRKKKQNIFDDLLNINKKTRSIRHKQSSKSHLNAVTPSDFFLDMDDLVKNNKKSKVVTFLNDDIEMKLQKRERLKKNMKSVDILKYYVKNQQLELKQQQTKLLQALIKIQSSIQKYLKNNELNLALQSLYQILTLAVDVNQMNFFCLLVDFIGQICYFMEDYHRSFYFFQQLRISSTYNQNFDLKINSLIGMAKNSNKLNLFKQAILFLKKGLQYSWHINHKQNQLYIYDLIGLNYYYLGNFHKATYFHTRFTLGAYQDTDSAIKLISTQILNDYHFYVKSLEKENLTSLFLEYSKLPIKGINEMPVEVIKLYDNYGKQGESPRRNKNIKQFNEIDFDAKKLIKKLLETDKQFLSQIPNPTVKDISMNYTEKYKKKSLIKDYNIFEKTPFYQQRFHKKLEYDHDHTNLSLYKYPLQNLIQNRLNRKSQYNIWEKIKQTVKINKFQINDKDDLMTKHLNKQRRDDLELKAQRMRYLSEAINKLILDYIDPLSNYKKR